MSTARFETRMAKEMQMITQPPHGIACWCIGETNNHLQASVSGGQDTPYENGEFKLDILIPERYPFQPPNVTFVTPIYHPNIDTSGRICLDILKLPPGGTWRPALNIVSVLTCVQQLMNEPNADDPLMPDIAKEFKFNRPLFLKNAKEWTLKHAMSSDCN